MISELIKKDFRLRSTNADRPDGPLQKQSVALKTRVVEVMKNKSPTRSIVIYLWLDEYWLAAYRVPDYRMESKKIDRLLRFHLPSLILGLILIVAAVVYKKVLSPVRDGFPEYFTFLVLVAFVSSISFFPTARRFINWRAFSLTLFFILLISLLWEATLAVPYQWWDYQPKQMMGLRIGAWAGLPIEAVCVWIAVTYTTVG